MPAYDYECTACGDRFEVRQGIAESPLKSCPKCGGEVRRMIGGGAGVIVRGGDSRGKRATGCSLEESGRTCCGRGERCGSPACGGEGRGGGR